MMQAIVDIQGVLLHPLKIKSGPFGKVLHAIRKSDQGYSEFGEVYFSTVEMNAVKGWKRHNNYTLNLVVPVGKVTFILFDDRAGSLSCGMTREITLSIENYARLTIPSGVWFVFRGDSPGVNLVMSFSEGIHDPSEVTTKLLTASEMPVVASTS